MYRHPYVVPISATEPDPTLWWYAFLLMPLMLFAIPGWIRGRAVGGVAVSTCFGWWFLLNGVASSRALMWVEATRSGDAAQLKRAASDGASLAFAAVMGWVPPLLYSLCCWAMFRGVYLLLGKVWIHKRVEPAE